MEDHFGVGGFYEQVSADLLDDNGDPIGVGVRMDAIAPETINDEQNYTYYDAKNGPNANWTPNQALAQASRRDRSSTSSGNERPPDRRHDLDSTNGQVCPLNETIRK